VSARDCGCDGTLPDGRAENRAGLPAIGFRTGTHGEFLARMLAALPRQEVPDPRADDVPHTPLRALTTRRADDPAVALLDAWAAALDVLAFQQERIANESYLGTATERLSVRELARAIGYELAPGVAAETRLAFTVESADDPFRSVAVPGGTQVMSVPSKPGDIPQTFETLEEITARADFNAIPPRLERQQVLALRRVAGVADPVLVLVDTDESFDLAAIPADTRQDVTAANAGEFHPLDAAVDFEEILDERATDTLTPRADVILPAIAVDEIRLRGIATSLAPGDRLLAVGRRGTSVQALPLLVREVALDPGYDQTRLVVQPLGTAAAPNAPAPLAVPVLRPSIRLAFRTPLLRVGQVHRAPLPLQRASVAGELRRTSWRAADLQAMVKVQRWSIPTLLAILRQPPPAVAPPLGAAVPGIHALRVRSGFFGSAAPKQEMLAKPENQRVAGDGFGSSWDSTPRTIWQNSQGGSLDSVADTFLERAVEGVAPDSWVVIEAPGTAGNETLTRTLSLRVNRATTISRNDFALSGKATGLLLNQLDGGDFAPGASQAHFTFRLASANLASARIPLAGLPIPQDVAEGETDLTLGRLVLELLPGAAVALSGERADAPGVRADEIALLSDVRHIGGFTRLTFASGLAQSFRRPGLAVNANVARASHGETVSQPLGSGDATLANQAFALPRLPLTFLKDSRPPGRRSALVLRVDGIAWEEQPGLYESAPTDRHFMLRLDEDGTTRVVFGDGVRGARLPTGSLNLVATWRVGTGPVGEVPDGALTLLRTRPLGIRAVVNPDAATGASQTESMDQARTNAPSTVRTLGRIVSLADYEDSVRTWPGFAKARAEVVWFEGQRVVHVTVGLASGLAPLPTDPALIALRAAIDGMRDGADRVEIQGFAELPFAVMAKLTTDPAREAEAVRVAAQAALEAGFGFAARAFAEPVTGARVIAVLQAVPGVISLDLDLLAPVDAPAAATEGHSALLRAAPARDVGGTLMPAELLLVSPAHITLTAEAADAG
jgi:predicted phage baseplate assembly protein